MYGYRYTGLGSTLGIRPALPRTRTRQGLAGRAYVLGMVQSSMHVGVGGTEYLGCCLELELIDDSGLRDEALMESMRST